MNLRELVGKNVIRTRPFIDKNLVININKSNEVIENFDYSFCDCYDVKIKVIDVVQDTPIVKITSRGNLSYIRPISGKYDDCNWKDVTEVYKRIDEINAKELENFIQKLVSI